MSITSSWFRSGTVSVTKGQRVVQGFSSAWVSHLTPIGTGDAFTTDFTTFYEVVEVVSDTQIKLDRAYAGTTATKVPYAIVRNGSSNFSVRTASAVQKSLAWYQEQLGIQNKLLTDDGDVVIELPTGESITLWSEKKKQAVFEAHDAALTKLEADKRAEMDALLAENFYREFAMSKAEFDAQREIRKLQNLGAGFLEWGAGHVKSTCINLGMWVSGKNLHLGKSGSTSSTYASDRSRTPYPEVLADGVCLKLRSVSYESSALNRLIFPDAPDGTTTYDTTTGEFHKHSSVFAAFGGLLEDSSPQIVTGIHYSNCTASFNNVNVNLKCNWNIRFKGREVVCRFRVGAIPNGGLVVKAVDGMYTSDPMLFSSARFRAENEGEIHEFRFTPTVDSWRFFVESADGETPAVGSITDLSVLPATEKVIDSRKDLVMLEVWYEDTSELGVLFPYGNVQFWGYSWNGLVPRPVNSVGVPQPYTSFGEWDTKTDGKGFVIADMAKEDLKKFITDPANNCFYDPRLNKLIQVRYRVRIIEGYGDQWDNVRPYADDIGAYLRYDSHNYVQIQGKSHTVKGLGKFIGDNCLVSPRKPALLDRWALGQFNTEVLNSNKSAYGDVIAIPIALVQRLNKGAFHPSYNPWGTRVFKYSEQNNVAYWYESASLTGIYKPTCQMDCFVSWGINDGRQDRPAAAEWTGSMDSTSAKPSGRQDHYQYHDMIYTGQVLDLRISARYPDHSVLLETATKQALIGEMRGWDQVPFTRVNPKTYTVRKAAQSGGGYYISISNEDGSLADPLKLLSGKNNSEYCPEREHQFIYNVTQNKVYYPSRLEQETGVTYLHSRPMNHSFYEYVNRFPANGMQVGDQLIIIDATLLTAHFDEVPFVDVIGHPSKILELFPAGVMGRWLPVVPDNTQHTFDFYQKISTTTPRRIYTIDGGNNWKSSGWTVATVQNAYVTTLESTMVAWHPYRVLSRFTQSGPNYNTIAPLGSVIVTTDNNIGEGNRLHSSLTWNVGKNDYSPERQCRLEKLNTGRLLSDGILVSNTTTHSPIPFGAPQNESRGVKALCALVDIRGYLYLQLYATELIYDETQQNWGDNGSVYINGRESSKRDDNGHEVKSSLHQTMIPLSLADNKAYGTY